MNNKIKTISAALLAAAMCASFAGCSKKEDNGVYVDKNGNVSVNESKFEDHVNSVFGGESNTASSSTETSQSEEKYEMTDEIKNAAFNSGLVQINNEVFQQGGYITVADFVEKYKDTYDITYWTENIVEKGAYEDCKEFLVEYKEPKDYIDTNVLSDVKLRESYFLKLTPKNGENKGLRAINAVVGNFTSPNEKITLDKAIVIGYRLASGPRNSNGSSEDTVHHMWLPEGFGLTANLNNPSDSVRRKQPADMEMANEDYTRNAFVESLEQKGFSSSEQLSKIVDGQSSAIYDKKYYKDDDSIYVYCVGEANLFGKKPVYEYYIYLNSDTDKVDKVSLYLLGFVE